MRLTGAVNVIIPVYGHGAHEILKSRAQLERLNRRDSKCLTTAMLGQECRGADLEGLFKEDWTTAPSCIMHGD